MMESEKNAFIDACVESSDVILQFMKLKTKPSSKSSCSSIQARKFGNSLYVTKLHDDVTFEEILKFYCQSICLAPTGTEELALAYANRSAFLQHISRHKECIEDIDRAIGITNSNILKEKLLCRKTISQGWLRELNMKSQLLEKTDSSLYITKTNRKREKKETEVLKALPEKNYFDSVAIKHSKKYGRHLIATRNFQPGEILFTEKLSATVLNLKKGFTNCHNCMHYFWSGVPCEYCDWAMFCSEECKDEAMENYHDLECPTITVVKEACLQFTDYFHISFRLLIMAVKEAGSVKKLKTELESHNKLTGDCVNGDSQEEKYRTSKFINIYELQADTSTTLIRDQNKMIVLALISLQKYTKFFGPKSKCSKLIDFLMDDNFLFIGSLLCKLIKITSINSYYLQYENKACQNFYFDDSKKCLQNLCCSKGRGITQIASFINHSCIPNVGHCFTDDGKIVIFAVQSIKTNSQIFDCYGRTFYQSDFCNRLKVIKKYNFICDCQACQKNRSSGPHNLNKDFTVQISPNLRRKVSEMYANIRDVLRTLSRDQSKIDQKTIEKLSNKLTKATKLLGQSSTMCCILSEGLTRMCNIVYGFKSRTLIYNFNRVLLHCKSKS